MSLVVITAQHLLDIAVITLRVAAEVLVVE